MKIQHAFLMFLVLANINAVKSDEWFDSCTDCIAAGYAWQGSCWTFSYNWNPSTNQDYCVVMDLPCAVTQEMCELLAGGFDLPTNEPTELPTNHPTEEREACRESDIRLAVGVPYYFHDGSWQAICGHYFWDTSSIDVFCSKLGKSNAMRGQILNYLGDLYIGECSTQEQLNTLTCNKHRQTTCYKSSPSFTMTCDGLEDISSCGGVADACADVDCGEHGLCEDGTCICRGDYTGNNCEIAPVVTECSPGDEDNSNPCMPKQCMADGTWAQMVIDCPMCHNPDESVDGECCPACRDECADGEEDLSNPCNTRTCLSGMWIDLVVDCFAEDTCTSDGHVFRNPGEDECCGECVDCNSASKAACQAPSHSDVCKYESSLPKRKRCTPKITCNDLAENHCNFYSKPKKTNKAKPTWPEGAIKQCVWYQKGDDAACIIKEATDCKKRGYTTKAECEAAGCNAKMNNGRFTRCTGKVDLSALTFYPADIGN